MKTKLINYFRNPENICWCIGLTVGMSVSFLFFFLLGAFNAPTKEDFSHLHKQEKLIIENFENVYNYTNATISINEEDIVITIVSEENLNYLIKMTFSKDKKLISSEEISNKPGYRKNPVSNWVDKIEIWFVILVIGMILGLMISVLSYETYKIIKKFR